VIGLRPVAVDLEVEQVGDEQHVVFGVGDALAREHEHVREALPDDHFGRHDDLVHGCDSLDR